MGLHIALSADEFQEGLLRNIYSSFPSDFDDANSDYDYQSDSDLEDSELGERTSDFFAPIAAEDPLKKEPEGESEDTSSNLQLSPSHANGSAPIHPDNMHHGRVILLKHTAFST